MRWFGRICKPKPTSPTPRSSFFFLMTPRPPRSTLFPYTTLFRSLTVNDGATTTTTHFQVTVTPVNDPPSITPIADQTILEDGTTGPLSFTIGDIDNDISELSVSGAFSSTDLWTPVNVLISLTCSS